VCVVLGFEHSASCLLGRRSTTRATPPAPIFIFLRPQRRIPSQNFLSSYHWRMTMFAF
jgi:hypothetical protein